jgi:hypothetical protein
MSSGWGVQMAMEALRFCVQHRHVVNRALLGAEKARRSQVLQRSFVCLDSWRIRRKRLRCLYQRQWIRLAASAFRSWRQSCEYLHSLRRVVLPAFATWLTFLQRKLEKRATLLKVWRSYVYRLASSETHCSAMLRCIAWLCAVRTVLHRSLTSKVLLDFTTERDSQGVSSESPQIWPSSSQEGTERHTMRLTILLAAFHW